MTEAKLKEYVAVKRPSGVQFSVAFNGPITGAKKLGLNRHGRSRRVPSLHITARKGNKMHVLGTNIETLGKHDKGWQEAIEEHLKELEKSLA